MSIHVKPGTFAPHVDALSDETAINSTSIASAAANTARLRPGNDPENDAHTTSPGSTPASAMRRTTYAAQSGLVAVRFACKSPSVVVMLLHSKPMSPVRFGSIKASTGYPAASLARAMTLMDAAIIDAARCSAAATSIELRGPWRGAPPTAPAPNDEPDPAA